jgi:hypothetical protein
MKSAIIKRLPAAAASLIYLLLSLLFFGTVGNYGRMYVGWGLDPIGFVWFLNWWPWAIAHGLNPFISYYVWYPHGFNMTWATSMPVAALLMWPLTWLSSAVVSYNVLSLAAPALSAWTAFLLARYLTRNKPASFIGGYLFGFSSYELGEMLGHLNLNLIFVVPLLVLLVIQRIRGDLSRPRFVAALALAMLVQLGFSSELLATTCFFGAITWAIFLAFATDEERRRLWRVAGEIILAAGIMALVAAPFLYFFAIQDRADIPFQIHDPAGMSNDPLNFILPYEVFPAHTLFWANPLPGLHAYADNAGYDAYLGLPLILILILQLRELRRRPYLKPLLLSILVMIILSLGPALHIANVATRLWLPWSLAMDLPLIKQALPNRFSMYVALAAGLIAALWLSAASTGRERAGRYTFAVLACLFLIPNPAMLRHWNALPLQPFFEPQNVAASLEKDANVIILPYDGPSLLWQWQSGMRFTQSGGYVGFTPPLELENWPVVSCLFTGKAGPGFESDLSGFCVAHRVSAILIGPGTPDTLVAAISALHWQETKAHGMRVVRVPDPDFLHFHLVSGDYWPQDNWMGRQVNIVNHGQPLELWITGQHRPIELGPVEIRATVNGSEVASYRIGQLDTEVLRVPANASVTLTASSTFVPNGRPNIRSTQSFIRQLRNLRHWLLSSPTPPRDVDQRSLSVVLNVQPER